MSKLLAGTLYRNKYSKSIMKLERECFGSWYLSREDNDGTLKTISISCEKMINLLKCSFEKYEEKEATR